tara:strand:+ start:197 stop:1708 length:1512 start_codon:yes stop_codon:yes gene_type:complete
MAMLVGRNQPNSYRIESITISNSEGNSYEVSNMMQSFQITESIYQMFLTGNIVLLDNINLFNRIGFSGQEYIRIHIGGIQGEEEIVPEDQQINQVFRIFNVTNHYRDIENPKNQVYSLEFCSPLLYLARTQRISQCYRGKTGTILNKICEEKLNFKKNKNRLNVHVKGGSELGNHFGVFANPGDESGMIVPNWSVYKTLEWLRDHTSDDSESARPWGDSYYFYQTALNGFRFHNVESMLSIEYLNGKVKFSPRMGDGDDSFNYDFVEGRGNDILSFNKNNTHNVIHNHQMGLYSGSIQVFDPKNKTLVTIDSQFTQQFPLTEGSEGEYKKKNAFSVAPNFRLGVENIKIPPDGGVGTVLDPASDAFKGDSIIENHGASINFDYNNPFTMGQGINISGHSHMYGTERVKFDRDRVERLFASNRMNIQISGRTNLSAGMVINIDLKQPTPSTMVKDEVTHNGRMLVEGITWLGTPDALETQLSVTTDGYQVNLDNYEDHEGFAEE